ncbi:hypothetical protein [Methylotenera sp.]|uniref:hypothetical protein n=1 Tax=Methylotenera sp. TaxID=2051956 RepID=UPI002ED9AD2F
MNTNQDTTLTNQDEFDINQPFVTQEQKYKYWQESKSHIKASEQRIQELEETIKNQASIISGNEKEIMLMQLAIDHKNIDISELTESNNQLREFIEVNCANNHGKMVNGNMLSTIAKEAISSTPTQSLALHDNEVIERCAKVIENGNFLTDKSTEAMLAKCASKAIRALKVTP